MMFLLTSFIAALALWSLVRIVMQRAAIAPNPIQAPGPDSLYFEMRTGLILAAGAHISQLLGYRRAADCLAQFDGAAHFKNASLVQLISGAVKPEALVLQTAQGDALPGALRIRVIEGVEAVEVQAATKVERRARVLTPSDASWPALPIPIPLAPGPLFSVLAASHAGDAIETYHALFDSKSLRLQPSPDLNRRMGFLVNNRWLSSALWQKCLDPDDYERVLQCLTGQVVDDVTCRVATLVGELLFLRLTVIALPDALGSFTAGANAGCGAGLLKIQLDQQTGQAEGSLTAQRRQGGPVGAPASRVDKARSGGAGTDAASPDGVALTHDELKGVGQARPLPALASLALDRDAENKDQGSAGRVLLIEDDPVVRQALLPVLSEAGLSVTTAASLNRAINLWQKGAFDLVITDRNLGRDSILPLLDEMAHEGSTVPVMLMTADPFDHAAVHTTLAKPFDLAAFQDFLEAGLDAMHAAYKQRLGVAP
jgi:CheY-like chemotaxis protein